MKNVLCYSCTNLFPQLVQITNETSHTISSETSLQIKYFNWENRKRVQQKEQLQEAVKFLILTLKNDQESFPCSPGN